LLTQQTFVCNLQNVLYHNTLH